MKRLIVFMLGLMTLTFVACNKAPNDKEVKVYQDATVTHYEEVKDSTGKVVNQELVKTDMVAANPTWGQAWSYSFEAGNTFWFILGFVLFGVAAYIFIQTVKDKGPFKNPAAAMLFTMIFLVAGLGSIGTKPATIKWNNTKSFQKAYWDKVIKEEGSSKRLWDSLQNNCRLVGGSTKGCK